MADSAGIQTTTPLVFGLSLDSSFALVASAGSVPVTSKDADLRATSSAGDLGISSPLALGLLLATNGLSSYTITASAGAVPVTSQSAIVYSTADTAQVVYTAPLALGLLLTDQSYTLTASSVSVPVNFAPSDGTEYDGPTYGASDAGSRKRRFVYEKEGKLVVTTSASVAAQALYGKAAESPAPVETTVAEVKAIAEKYDKAPDVVRALTERDFAKAYAIYSELWQQQDEEDIEALLLTVH